MQIKVLLKLFKFTVDTSTYDEMPEQLNFSVMLIWRYNEFIVFNTSSSCSVSFNFDFF